MKKILLSGCLIICQLSSFAQSSSHKIEKSYLNDRMAFSSSTIEKMPGTKHKEVILKPGMKSEVKYSVFKDKRDGKSYTTVKIGKQTWMAENLNYKMEKGAYCMEGDSAYCAEHGRLYKWGAAQKACPKNWHLPSEEEWQELEKQIGIPESEMESIGWRGKTQAQQLTSENGFGLKFSGYGNFDGHGGDEGTYVGYWSSTEHDEKRAWGRFFASYFDGIRRTPFSKLWSFSIRCIKD